MLRRPVGHPLDLRDQAGLGAFDHARGEGRADDRVVTERLALVQRAFVREQGAARGGA